jgi:pimeloyl-ACP methyl ester carboxylesterase
MGIRRFPLVGHALGAAVALEYATHYPDQVEKVVAVSLPLTADSISRKLLNFANDSIITRLLWRRQFAYKEVRKEAEKTGPEAISLSVQSVTQMDVEERLSRLTQFTDLLILTVYGDKDNLIDPAPARNLDGHWPNIRLIGLADSRHFPMLDEAAKFNRLLKDFLEIENNLAALELKEEWRRRTR